MECRPTGWRGRYFSAMGFDDRPANGESHADSVLFRCLERFEKHLSIAGESGAVDDIGQLHTGSIPVSLVYREKHSDQLGARPRNGNERDNRDKENCRERNQRVKLTRTVSARVHA
jgi:hypothetical protein